MATKMVTAWSTESGLEKLKVAILLRLTVHFSNFSYHLTPLATNGDQIVETISLNGYTSENETIHTHPPFPPFVVVFVVS